MHASITGGGVGRGLLAAVGRAGGGAGDAQATVSAVTAAAMGSRIEEPRERRAEGILGLDHRSGRRFLRTVDPPQKLT